MNYTTCNNKGFYFANLTTFFMLMFALLLPGKAVAQAPASVAGTAFLVDVSNGAYPLGTNGYALNLFDNASTNFQIVGIDLVRSSSATYSYSTNSGTNVVLSLAVVDGILTYSLVDTLGFGTATSGSYFATNVTGNPNSYQDGTFQFFTGTAPTVITDTFIQCTIQTGGHPLATNGTFTIAIPVLGTNYTITGDDINTTNTTGTYSYAQTNTATGALQINDSVFGVATIFLAFSNATSGTFAIQSTAPDVFQIGQFVLTVTNETVTVTAQPSDGGTVGGGGTVLEGTSTSATATNNAGFEFLAWIGDGTGSSNPLVVMPQTNLNLIAYFAPTGSNITLAVFTNGVGSVSPNWNGKSLVQGRNYNLTATARSPMVFSNWTGSITTNKNPLVIRAESNIVVQANFILNPFLAVKGKYDGLFTSIDGVTEQTAGMLKGLTINQNGAYSGTLLINGGSHGFSGKFNLAGQATNKITRASSQGGPLDLEMTLQYNNIPPQITGTVSGTTNYVPWTAYLTADRGTNTVPAGEYTMLIPPDTNSAPPTNSPGGYGYALIDNNPAATTARVTGALADGTAFSESVPVSADGFVPLYANLYASKGLLLGWINIELTNTNAVAATGLTWIHPQRASGLYQNGFTNSILTNQILLSSWTNSSASGVLEGITNLVLVSAISNTNAAVNYPVTVSSSGEINSSSLRGTINPRTGEFNVIIGTGSDKITGFGAILLNATNGTNGGGYFLTPSNAQGIQLEP